MNRSAHRVSKSRFAPAIMYGVLFVLCSALILWRCRYGFANIDESFYLTIPYRLVQGDALFAHEWHLSQMSGVFLVPFVALYRAINGSLEGILLAARYLFTVCNMLCAVFVFFRCKRFHPFGAAIASLCLLLFAPYGVMAVSYNSVGILTLILACVLLLTGTRRIETILAGFLFACAVLCNPYLIAVYLLLVLAAAAFFLPIRALQSDRIISAYALRLLFFTLGASTAAVLFFGFVFSRASLSEIIAALPHMMQDPEHADFSLLDKGISFLYHIIVVNRYTKFGYLGLGITALLCLIDKKRKQPVHKAIYFIAASVCALFLLAVIYIRNHTLNYLMWPLNCIAPFIFLLSDRAENRRIFLHLWVPGMLYAFCMHLSSNQKFYAISSASIVALVGSLLMAALFADEIRSACTSKAWRIGTCLVLILMCFGLLGTEARERYVNVFWDTSIETQTERIETGIDKGIVVSDGMYEGYMRDLALADRFEKAVPDAERVLFVAYNPHLYLMTEKRMGSYSAWLSYITAFTAEHLAAFYALQPELLPDAIYVEPQYAECAELLQQTLGYREAPFDFGILLLR